MLLYIDPGTLNVYGVLGDWYIYGQHQSAADNRVSANHIHPRLP